MTGSLYLETTLTLPPGDEDVVRKLQLDGAFRIDGGRFTDPTVQRQINELSLRASGKKAGWQWQLSARVSRLISAAGSFSATAPCGSPR